jgi:hypothetical protein
MLKRGIASAFVASFVVACSGGSSGASGSLGDAGEDGAVVLGQDAGGPRDAGGPMDAGATEAAVDGGGQDANAPSDASTIQTVRFGGTVSTDQGQPISGVTVCAYNHPELPCTMSDAAGVFNEAIPANDKTGVLFDKAGYGSMLIAVQTQGNDWANTTETMSTTAELQTYFAAGGITYPDAANGFLRVTASNMGKPIGEAGATFALVPPSGMGPLYADTNNLASTALTATSSGGIGRFGTLAPAPTMEVGAHCPPGTVAQLSYFGWPVSTDISKGTFPIVAGYETHIGFDCN